VIISFQKKQNGAILNISRTDGSATWSKTDYNGVIHDLCHYAVETTMGFKQAFYGFIDEGYDIGDFEKPRNQRPEALIPKNLPVEALQAEHMAGLFQMSLTDPKMLDIYADNLRMALELQGLPYPDNLDDARILTIADQLRGLITQWNKLGPEAKLTLG
jgi:hypothetical protein